MIELIRFQIKVDDIILTRYNSLFDGYQYSRTTFSHVFVVSALPVVLAHALALLPAGDEGPDPQAVLLAQHALRRRLVHLHREHDQDC